MLLHFYLHQNKVDKNNKAARANMTSRWKMMFCFPFQHLQYIFLSMTVTLILARCFSIISFIDGFISTLYH